MNNYQAQLYRMNYLANTQLNINPYIPNYNFPIRDEYILSLVEIYFSKKNLNKNLDMRLQIINEEGLIPIEYINESNIKEYIFEEERFFLKKIFTNLSFLNLIFFPHLNFHLKHF